MALSNTLCVCHAVLNTLLYVKYCQAPAARARRSPPHLRDLSLTEQRWVVCARPRARESAASALGSHSRHARLYAIQKVERASLSSLRDAVVQHRPVPTLP